MITFLNVFVSFKRLQLKISPFDLPFVLFPQENFFFPGHNFQFFSTVTVFTIFTSSRSAALFSDQNATSTHIKWFAFFTLWFAKMRAACKRIENLETLFREIYDSKTCYAENLSQNVKQLNPFRLVFVLHFQLFRL